MEFIFEEDFRLVYKGKGKKVYKQKVFVVDNDKQLLVQIGVMVKEVHRSEMYYFESLNPEVNSVFNKTQLTYRVAKNKATHHFAKLDWGQILEGGLDYE